MVGAVMKLWRRQKPLGKTRAAMLNETQPVSRVFGLDRGSAIDRYYIERFLRDNQGDIRGRVLEVESDSYTKKFGGNRVQQSDILHATLENPQATIIADLSAADSIATNSFDCIILTQTLQFIYDLQPAVRNLYRILKPEGVLLATVPGISQISQYDMNRWGDYWRFTTLSASRLFQHAFRKTDLQISAYGNALVASAFLHGLATEELQEHELSFTDADYQVVITIRAVRESAFNGPRIDNFEEDLRSQSAGSEQHAP